MPVISEDRIHEYCARGLAHILNATSHLRIKPTIQSSVIPIEACLGIDGPRSQIHSPTEWLTGSALRFAATCQPNRNTEHVDASRRRTPTCQMRRHRCGPAWCRNWSGLLGLSHLKSKPEQTATNDSDSFTHSCYCANRGYLCTKALTRVHKHWAARCTKSLNRGSPQARHFIQNGISGRLACPVLPLLGAVQRQYGQHVINNSCTHNVL